MSIVDFMTPFPPLGLVSKVHMYDLNLLILEVCAVLFFVFVFVFALGIYSSLHDSFSLCFWLRKHIADARWTNVMFCPCMGVEISAGLVLVQYLSQKREETRNTRG